MCHRNSPRDMDLVSGFSLRNCGVRPRNSLQCSFARRDPATTTTVIYLSLIHISEPTIAPPPDDERDESRN